MSSSRIDRRSTINDTRPGIVLIVLLVLSSSQLCVHSSFLPPRHKRLVVEPLCLVVAAGLSFGKLQEEEIAM